MYIEPNLGASQPAPLRSPSDKLSAALAWAAKGFRVFPLQENGKVPLSQGWTTSASIDPAVIRDMWLDPVTRTERNYNVGFLTSEHVVLDVDTKNGKPGLATFCELGLSFDTLTSRTPTGGFHLVFAAIGRTVGQAPIGPGIDVRSHHGYVVAPGSTIDGVPYTVECDLPVAEFPVELRPLLKAPRSRRDADGVSHELDLPGNVELAAHWLRREAPVAIQGQNGDDQTYRVACRVRDYGVSEGPALDLMLEEWNGRCEPPWDAGELQRKIENAFAYATRPAGAASASALFGDVVDVPLPQDKQVEAPAEALRGHAGNGGPVLVLHEDAAAHRFAEVYKIRFKYDHDMRSWFEWNGRRWQKDNTGCARFLARELVRDLAREEDERVQVGAGRATFSSGVEQLARCDPALAVTSDFWDLDQYLLGTPGGPVDLRTGRFVPANPQDGITKSTSTTPAGHADCPLWLRFLDETTGGDAEMIRFIQQWLGYSLTGDVKEHALVFGYGPGGNGKSVLLNTATGIFGDYAATAAMGVFVATKNEQHSTNLAMLRGARLVTATETEEGRMWAEAKIKQITGGDRVTAHFMHKDNFTYTPQFKLFIVGNHMPTLANVDDAGRRRFNIVPFVRQPQRPDRDLEAKLRDEWPGILRWMIDGCLDWQRNGGFARPRSVVDATADYFGTQDVIGQFLAEECDLDPLNPQKTVAARDLFAAWTTYAKATGEAPGSHRAFTPALEKRGIKRARTNQSRLYRGIALKKAVWPTQ